MIDPNDINAVTQAMQRHLSEGSVGFHGLYAEHQIDYRACYSKICDLSAKWNNSQFNDPLVRELRSLLNDLGEFKPVGPEVFAVNTTYHGREALENHSAPVG